MLALHKGRPERLTLRDFISAFIVFREETIIRRTKFELQKARERAHILIGLAVAVANIDAIIALIRNAPDPAVAREKLMAQDWAAESVQPLLVRIGAQDNASSVNTYRLSDIQAKAILDLRLHRLTGLEREKIAEELDNVVTAIEGFLYILNNRAALYDVMRGELQSAKIQFATPRRTEILDIEADEDIEDLIPREDMVVTISHAGYIKRVPLATYRAQKRGGKGRSGIDLKDDDAVIDVYVANTHTTLLFFTTKGIVHSLKVYKLPLGNPQARGKAMINLLPLAQDEKISVIMPLPTIEEGGIDAAKMNIVFATSHGTVRRNRLEDFMNIRSNGLIAMKLGEGENLIAVKTATDDEDALLISRLGKAMRFPVSDLRVFAGRTSTGVRGIQLADADEVMSMSIITGSTASVEDRDVYLKIAATERRMLDEEKAFDFAALCIEAAASMDEKLYQTLKTQEQFILTITDRGFGKRTSCYEYRQANRGGQGVAAMALTDKTGQMVAAYPIQDDAQIMMVSDQGQLIRMPVHGIRIAGRATQGVTLFRVSENEHVVSVATLREDSESTATDEQA
jgi:DNA gyrase subunit A